MAEEKQKRQTIAAMIVTDSGVETENLSARGAGNLDICGYKKTR